MADTVVTIFIEGDTEVDFYKKLVALIRERAGGRLNCRVEIKNVKGVGNYQKKVSRVFEKSIVAKHPDAIHKVALCYDSDAFEYSRKPPVDWPAVISDLSAKGADTIIQVKAVRSIEDWFLYDPNGLRRFLRLGKKVDISRYKGQSGLSQLFLLARRPYVKGSSCEGLIDALDLELIIPRIEVEIRPLWDLLIES